MSTADDNPNVTPFSGNPFCCECGAANYAGATKCYLCGREFTEAERAALPRGRTVGQPQPTEIPSALVSPIDQAARTSPTARGPLTYSLSTLFLIVTLAGVCFGLIAAAPALGIPVTLLVTPALIRTFVILRRDEQSPTTEDKVYGFVGSLGIAFMVMLAAGIAFFAACSAVGFGLAGISLSAAILGGLVAGAIAAIVVAVWIFRRTLPRRKR